jgi:hypothetical protein
MTEVGFVPPVARKKLQVREQRRIQALHQNRLASFALCTMIFSFIIYNVWYIRWVKTSVIDDAAEYHALLGGRPQGGLRGRAWISQDSQPFVSILDVSRETYHRVNKESSLIRSFIAVE